MKLIRWLRDLRFRVFYELFTKSVRGLETFGNTCQWTFSPRDCGPQSTILCAGAGHDISFEKALISNYGCRVVLLDPSPTGIATVERESLPPEKLIFYPMGLADVDGLLEFHEPHDPMEGSFVGGAETGGRVVRFLCKTLSTLIGELGWSHIDLLKIDIEGFEYAVLREILEKKLNVKQICVEFHHGPQFGRSNRETVRLILALRKAGYDLVYRSYWDHTFLLRET